MDLSFKSLATVGILLGGLGWFFDDSAPTKASRKPTASEKSARKVKAVPYQPSLEKLDAERSEEIATEVNVVQDEVIVEGDSADEAISVDANDASAVAVENRDFENIRREITQHLTDGNVDSAIDFAERKLEETLKDTAAEDNSISYLHEFIMQHADNPDDELDVTLTALKGAQNANVRRHIYDKFQNHAPNMLEDLNRELDAAGVSLE